MGFRKESDYIIKAIGLIIISATTFVILLSRLVSLTIEVSAYFLLPFDGTGSFSGNCISSSISTSVDTPARRAYFNKTGKRDSLLPN